ncbi:MAG: pyridoxal phosphate-dependent aminotransferase [Candidatus Eremiobacteraeota bacterium]|nr:pyridoxal phosphate-dependent aminotransferase [Candidatus Eremiobacteraeota bacterium]MBV8721408.1 pyridoxal phosphate-dependent aminotransferase [Candidatus Eremiobacteraeota bacterium]
MLAVHEDRIAAAVARLGSENAFEVLARARQLEAQGRRVVHMEIGEPDFDTPEHIKKAAVEALYDNHTHYTPSSGIPSLRETIAAYASRFRRITPAYTLDNVVISPGAKPIIWNVLSAILDPGDDFVYFDPAYPAYASCASYQQANVHAIPLLESRNWRMDLDELERRVSDKTKAVVINSPHNPTGGVLTKGDLERIASLAERHDFLVIADEIYSRNFYLDVPYVSIAALPGMRERTIIVDGFSKAYAMTGWRLGYAIMPERLAKTVTLFNNNTFSCVATFVQMAGIAALTGDDTPVQRMNDIFRQRRDRLVNGLNDIPGVSCTLPEGAFYAFPNVSEITHDDRALAKFLLEEGGVACGGGSSFGAAGKGYLRFSYAASLEDIDWALESIAKTIPKFKG